jgi:hypothetical protein
LRLREGEALEWKELGKKVVKPVASLLESVIAGPTAGGHIGSLVASRFEPIRMIRRTS